MASLLVIGAIKQNGGNAQKEVGRARTPETAAGWPMCQVVICIPKITILLYIGRPWNGKCFYIILPFGILLPFGYSLWSFVTFFSRFGVLYKDKSGLFRLISIVYIF
jgi:hypothetical protein